MSNLTSISPTLLERVDAGVEWLDENLPDWRKCVDPKILDMAWEETCILGQYHQAKYGDPSFDKILHACFNDNADRVIELGFLDPNFNYSELNQAWLQKFVELGMIPNGKEATG